MLSCLYNIYSLKIQYTVSGIRADNIGVPKSLKDPHIASVSRPLGPHIAGDPGPHISSDMGTPVPISLVIWGLGVPILGGPNIARTPV